MCFVISAPRAPRAPPLSNDVDALLSSLQLSMMTSHKNASPPLPPFPIITSQITAQISAPIVVGKGALWATVKKHFSLVAMLAGPFQFGANLRAIAGILNINCSKTAAKLWRKTA